jgi:hypothetical protein
MQCASCYRLKAEIGIRLLFVCIKPETYSCYWFILYQLIGFSPSVVCGWVLIDMDKPHILAQAAETDFYDLGSKFPVNSNR